MSALEAAALVSELRQLGVELVPDGDKVRFRPKSALSPELLTRLAQVKRDVIDVLLDCATRNSVPAAGAEQQSVALRRAAGRPNAVCLSCYGTRFVRLRNGRRSVCFGCERPATDEIVCEDNGAIGGVR